jgi:hypothetical protein
LRRKNASLGRLLSDERSVVRSDEWSVGRSDAWPVGQSACDERGCLSVEHDGLDGSFESLELESVRLGHE